MATSKTLTPTNVTISIPAMTDSPDASVFSNCVDKEADAINALNSKIQIELINVVDGREFNANEVKEKGVDISTLKQTYSNVYFLNFGGANGSNYYNFAFSFAYPGAGNNYMVGIHNISSTAKTLASFDVYFLCIK